MTYKLFIDDERFPVDDSLIARSSSEAIKIVADAGVPLYISFDHDLGGEDTSVVFIRWLIDYMLDNSIKFPNGFNFYVHSQNPIGKENIESLMRSFIEHMKE